MSLQELRRRHYRQHDVGSNGQHHAQDVPRRDRGHPRLVEYALEVGSGEMPEAFYGCTNVAVRGYERRENED